VRAPFASPLLGDGENHGDPGFERLLEGYQDQVSFLPAVKKTQVFHASENRASEAMSKLFDELRTEYDFICLSILRR
jgi:hypothetical protein